MGNFANGKAIGLRGVSNEMLKYSSSKELLETITKLYNLMIKYQITPNLFNLSILKPILKNEKKAKDDPNNTRPLAISDALANLYERVLLNLINKNHNENEKQFGFKRNSSCSHAIFTLTQAARHVIFTGKRLYACAIYATKAFDKVS